MNVDIVVLWEELADDRMSSLVTWRKATLPSPMLGDEESQRGLEMSV